MSIKRKNFFIVEGNKNIKCFSTVIVFLSTNSFLSSCCEKKTYFNGTKNALRAFFPIQVSIKVDCGI